MLLLLHFCVSAANLTKNMFRYINRKLITVAYFKQIMRPRLRHTRRMCDVDLPVA